MKPVQLEHGEIFETDKFKVFFGNQKSVTVLDHEHIQFGRQVHEADLLEISSAPHRSCHLIANSDGLWTSSVNVSLGIYTADCIPCFIICNKQIFSLHLGWRSLNLGLFDKALKSIDYNHKALIFLGPHIKYESFEVDIDLINSFEPTLPKNATENWCTQISQAKYKVSLQDIVKIKANAYKADFIISEIDTFTNANHHSYRREKGTRNRNISFAFLK